MLEFVPIFADPNDKPLRGFYAVHYEDTPENENSWSQFIDKLSDPEFRREFMKARKVKFLTNGYWGNYSISDASQRAMDEYLDVKDELEDAYLNNGIEYFLELVNEVFQPLNNYGGPTELIPHKGKPAQPKEPWVRLYAVKVSENLFLFTGGTIKLGQYMDDDEATIQEKAKLNRLRDCLKAEGMYDQEAYTELEL